MNANIRKYVIWTALCLLGVVAALIFASPNQKGTAVLIVAVVWAIGLGALYIRVLVKNQLQSMAAELPTMSSDDCIDCGSGG